MPRLDALGLTADPRSTPLSYPGQAVKSSYLLAEDHLHWLLPTTGRRLGQWRTKIDDGPLGRRARTNRDTLGQALQCLNTASADLRFPVLAIGSNAAPVQLRGKLADDPPVSGVVPVTRAQVSGLRVVHSAHVSNAGYIAYSVVADADAPPTLFFVLWLDRHQLERMDRTEPNYDLVTLDSERYPLELESGERLPTFTAYRSRWGALRAAPGEPPAVAGSQAALFDRLVTESWFRDEVGAAATGADAVACLRDSEELRKRVREVMHERGLAAPDGLRLSDGPSLPYGRLLPTPPGDDRYVVLGTPDALHRQGEQYVITAAEESGPRHVVVSNGCDPSVAPALGRLLARPDLVDRAGIVRVDQTLRNGIGIEIGETVRLRPAYVPRTPLIDLLISPRVYLLCRLQPASLPTVEQEICTVDLLTLQILGIADGDELVVEGIPAEGSTTVPSVRLRAHLTPAEILAQRISLSGGGLAARFPSTAETMGVDPDLPWIFVDSGIRTALGLAGTKLGVVRVRAARRNQVAKEFREILLLLTLAFIGLITVIQSTTWKLVATAALVVLALTAIHRRIRRRLGRRWAGPGG